MKSILPHNSTPLEYALEDVSARRLNAIPLSGLSAMFNIESCPAPALPWLAQQFGATEWNPEWSEAQQRAFIRANIETQRYRGTIGAVIRPLKALSYNIEIVEYAGTFTFDILVDTEGRELTKNHFEEIERIANTQKNVRSHLGTIKTSITKTVQKIRSFAAMLPDFIEDTVGEPTQTMSAAERFLAARASFLNVKVNH